MKAPQPPPLLESAMPLCKNQNAQFFTTLKCGRGGSLNFSFQFSKIVASGGNDELVCLRTGVSSPLFYPAWIGISQANKCQFMTTSTQRSKLSLNKVENFAFESKVKRVAEKLSFILRLWPGEFLMNILRDPQLVIFSHSTTFITFSCKSLGGFLFKFFQSWRLQNPEVALDFCVWPLCGRHPACENWLSPRCSPKSR